MTPLVTVERLSRVFDVSPPWLNRAIERRPRAFLTAVADVSFEIGENEVYGLVGESGSGKSTIGKIMVGLTPPTDGQVQVEGVELTGHSAAVTRVRGRIQMIFQDPYASLNPRWRVRDIVTEPVVAGGGDASGMAERLLEQVGLSAEDAAKFPHEFSGGQRQRICIARALSSEPKLIVCDEPTSALDVSVQAQVLNLMSDLRREHSLSYLFISHDLTVVRHMAHRVGVLYLGRLVEEADRDTMFAGPLHPYTRMLFEAAPRTDGFDREAAPPVGEIPDPTDPPSGCVFHPRCPLAEPRCREHAPELKRHGASRVACHVVTDPAG